MRSSIFAVAAGEVVVCACWALDRKLDPFGLSVCGARDQLWSRVLSAELGASERTDVIVWRPVWRDPRRVVNCVARTSCV